MLRFVTVIFVIFSWMFCFISCTSSQEAIVFSGALHGNWDKCGCTQNIGGGIARRAAYIKSQYGSLKSPKLLHLDAGGFADFFRTDGKLITEAIISSYSKLGLQAVNVSMRELAGDAAIFQKLAKKYDLPLISTNLAYQDSDEYPFSSNIKINFAGRKLRIFGVTRKVSRTWKDSDGRVIVANDPLESMNRAISELDKDEQVILLAYLPRRDLIELLKEVKGIDLALGCDGFSKTEEPEKVGDTLIIYPGDQGKNIGKVVLSRAESSLADQDKCELVFLPEEAEEDPELVKLFQEFGLRQPDAKQ